MPIFYHKKHLKTKSNCLLFISLQKNNKYIVVMKVLSFKSVMLCGALASTLSFVSCSCSEESAENGVYYPGEETTNQSSTEIIEPDTVNSTDSIAMPDSSNVISENSIPDSAKLITRSPGKVYGSKTFATASEAIEYMKGSSDWDKYADGILPQMADEHLPYAQKLLNSPYQHFIVVDKERMKVVLFDKYGRVEKEYTMACGKNYGTKQSDWDSRTPEGYFSAEGVYNSTIWLFKDKNGRVSPTRGQYGPRFIRLNTPITRGVGIHGTCSPGALGKRVSHGCIRIANENILELVGYVENGMPIIVNPSKKDVSVNKSSGYSVGKITTKKTVVETQESSLASDSIKSDSTKTIKTDTEKSIKGKATKSNKTATQETGKVTVPKAAVDSVKH